MFVSCVLSLCLLCLFFPCSLLVVGAECSWHDPTSGQEFNFAPLSFTSTSEYKGHLDLGGWWSETCTTDECAAAPEDQYEYLFNICGNVLHTPTENCSKNNPILNEVSAYQYNKTSQECKPVGKSTDHHEELLVPGKPSQGYKLRYIASGGEKCSSGIPRQLTVHVRCSANLPAEPQLNYDNNNHFKKRLSGDTECLFKQDCDIVTGDVYENSTCDYHVNLDTVFGCPLSCLADNLPCSNHGICAEDTNPNNHVTVTRCFCDVGYGGDKCQATVADSSSTSNPNTVLAVFVLILLFAALGLGYALYRKIRGFHGDYDHQYGQLSDGAKQGRGMSVNA